MWLIESASKSDGPFILSQKEVIGNGTPRADVERGRVESLKDSSRPTRIEAREEHCRIGTDPNERQEAQVVTTASLPVRSTG